MREETQPDCITYLGLILHLNGTLWGEGQDPLTMQGSMGEGCIVLSNASWEYTPWKDYERITNKAATYCNEPVHEFQFLVPDAKNTLMFLARLHILNSDLVPLSPR